MKSKKTESFVVWLTGLPGSGKTTIAKRVLKHLTDKQLRKGSQNAIYLSMDAIRPLLTWPHKPKYTEREREAAYKALIAMASVLHQNKISVVLDATAHRSVWRDKLRELVGKDFVEVYVRCKPEIAIARETKRSGSNLIRKKLYLDALKRLKSGKKVRGLGVVPGVDVPYEEPRRPEIVVDLDKMSVDECALRIICYIGDRKRS